MRTLATLKYRTGLADFGHYGLGGIELPEASAWMAGRGPGDPPPGSTDGQRESRLGLHSHPRCLEQSRASRRAVDDRRPVLKAEGIPPSGERPMSWPTFLRAHSCWHLAAVR